MYYSVYDWYAQNQQDVDSTSEQIYQELSTSNSC